MGTWCFVEKTVDMKWADRRASHTIQCKNFVSMHVLKLLDLNLWIEINFRGTGKLCVVYEMTVGTLIFFLIIIEEFFLLMAQILLKFSTLSTTFFDFFPYSLPDLEIHVFLFFEQLCA